MNPEIPHFKMVGCEILKYHPVSMFVYKVGKLILFLFDMQELLQFKKLFSHAQLGISKINQLIK